MRRLAVLCTLTAAMGLPARAGVVRLTTGMDHMRVQETVDRAVYGDTVFVAPGEYLMVMLPAGISLIGEEGPDSTLFRHHGEVIRASQTDSLTVIQGLTLDGKGGSEGVIAAEESQIRIRDCVIRNAWVGVRGVYSQFVLEDSRIEGCQNGIYLFESEGRIVGNQFTKCLQALTLVSSDPVIQRNEIRGNSIGISASEHSDPSIGGTLATANRFIENRTAIRNTALLKRNAVRTMTLYRIPAPFNYWGSDCPDSIEIFRGDVDYRPWVNETGERSLEACETPKAE